MNEITMRLQADHLILEALKEDISSEDVTTNSVMKEYVKGEVQLICKQNGIISGLEVFKRVFELLDERTEVTFYCKDGDAVKEGQLMGIVTTCGTELSPENEWHCNLYTFRSKAFGRYKDQASGYPQDDTEYAHI